MQIKPSDFGTDVRRQFAGSPLQNFEMELVARNVVTVCMRRGDEWKPFTWDDYRNTVDHLKDKQGLGEKAVLHQLVEKGIVDEKDGVFSVNKRFIATFSDYIKVER